MEEISLYIASLQDCSRTYKYFSIFKYIDL